MLFFQSEALLNEWLAAHKAERGAILSIPQVWKLSQSWYQDRLSAEYHGRTVEQVQKIFRELGLTSRFWE